MSDYLPPVIAEFVAKAAEYIGPVEAMAKAADMAREANDKLVLSIVDLEAAMALLSDKHIDISASVKGIAGPVAGAVAQIEALKAAMAGLGDKAVKITTDMNGTARAAAGWAFGFRLTGQALHWLVMGTLEVASTAIPALVALGAAAAGLYPTFSDIFDRMNALVTASGGLGGALQNSVGPLHQLGMNMGTLSQKMQPDAFIIFGSVINDLTGRFGNFSTMAEQAGNVLAAFATKITADLNGPAGAQLAGFFANAVKYMIQWGQVLGNLGHGFLNVVSSMFGVGQILLDVLVAISRAFLAITSNPVASFLIGIAAAMSAVYRYGQLMLTIFRWFAGSALISAISGVAERFLVLAANVGVADAALATLQYEILAPLVAFITGPVGIAIGVLVAALGIWYLASRNAGDATTQLIKNIQSMPPTAQNLAQGIGQLTAHLARLVQVSAQMEAINPTQIVPNAADIAKTTAALHKQVMEYLNLVTGMAQAGAGTGAVLAGENAIAVQSAITSGKVQALNQALDFYMQLVTGGTGGLAAFSQSLQNIGQVAGTTSNNLGTATGQMSLSVRQFADALTSFKGTGAGAWTNFDQIVGSTMPQLMDWFREAATLGATTNQAVSKAALDMAASMVRYAQKVPAARAEVLAFARANGINVGSFAALKAAIATSGANFGDLSKKVTDATIAMANLSQMAKNTSDILNTQVSTSIATAALKSTTFQTDLNNAMAALSSNVPGSAAKAMYYIDRLNQDQATAGSRAIAMAQQMGTSAGSIVSSASRIAQAMANARTQAQLLQAFINSMHGKSISVQVSFPTGGGGYINSGPSGGLPGGGTHGPQSNAVIINHGTVLSGQEVGRLVQAVANRKTIRNGSTQLFIHGRLH